MRKTVATVVPSSGPAPLAIIGGGSGNDSLPGTPEDDQITGGAGNDTLNGLEGNDLLDGGAGNDSMVGGVGNDTYVVDSLSDRTVETSTLATEIDTVQASISWTLAANLERLVLTGAGNLSGTGNTLANTLTGNTGNNQLFGSGGNDTLNGGTGNDTLDGGSGNDSMVGGIGNDSMTGGTGNDIYVVDVAGDVVTETTTTATEIDTVNSAVTFALGANLENLTLTGTGAANGTGNGLANSLRGNTADNSLSGGAGNDVLNGGVGNDTMTGDGGNDRYTVDAVGDRVIEAGTASNEIDSVTSSVTFTLGANVERLTLTGVDPLNGTGNASNNTLTGNTGNNSLVGAAGNDTLTGGDGNDTLNGGTQNDSMVGGAGNDTYSVDSAGDKVVETSTLAGEIDSVSSLVGFVLGAHVENLTLTGTGSTFGTGNELANKLTGNGSVNILSGGLGNDSLIGGAGDDTLGGGDGRDTLNGGLGNDAMDGGTGNDLYVVDAAGDTVSETGTSTAEIDSVSASVNFTLPDNVETLVLTGSSIIFGTGNPLPNKLTGNGVQNILSGEGGNDTLDGGAGNDTVQGGSGNDTLLGNTGNDTLDAGEGNDLLDGGTGNDALTGGTGNDRYRVDAIGDTVTESGTSATEIDTVESQVSFTLGANLERLLLQGSAPSSGTGNALANQIVGNTGANTLAGAAGNDTLDGGAGADSLAGGADGDRYIVDNAGDVVDETGANTGAADMVVSSVDFTLGANLETLVLTGAAALAGTGNALDNTLTGNTGANALNGEGGNDSLDGGAGSDTLAGGGGNDVYLAVQADDTVQEAANAGFDSVQTALVSYVMSNHVEALAFTGTGDFTATGNALGNLIEGAAGNDTLSGGAGNDTLIGGTGNDVYLVDSAQDTVTEGVDSGTDRVDTTLSVYALGDNVEELVFSTSGNATGTGNALANRITGGAGNDTLLGNEGNDTLIGGAGNDTYIVDDAGDQTLEVNGGGTADTVRAALSWTLADHVESLEFDAFLVNAGVSGTGNSQDNVITGTNGNNALAGLDGSDVLDGRDGNDTLAGGNGNDTLAGGIGNDAMTGGAGNDTYDVDAAGDSVSEQASGGTDLVRSALTYTLGTEVENLTLLGAGGLSGTGNGLANLITGNDNGNLLTGLGGDDTLVGAGGNDILDGGGANDSMAGGIGNDRYFVDSVADTVTELAGNGTSDEVQTALVAYTLAGEVETLVYTGAAAFAGTGNGGANRITGSIGGDTLDGGVGNDTLVGGQGDDTYRVDSAGDVTTESAGQGKDQVLTNLGSWTLAGEIEDLTYVGAGSFSGTGNALVNSITGGAFNDTLAGLGERDSLIGGLGNDLYIWEGRDFIIEQAGGGIDTVQSEVESLTDSLNEVENYTLLGSLPLNARGNALNNVLTGNAGANSLDGDGGNDTVIGGGGADKITGGSGNDSLSGGDLNDDLFGNDGNDTLDGGTGNDRLDGNTGNDLYVIDGADTVVEAAAGGIDTLSSAVNNLTLGSELENATLLGSLNLDVLGNTLDNVIAGNLGANNLRGGDGNDSLFGSEGNDSLRGDNGNDTLNGGGGADDHEGGSGDDVYFVDQAGDKAFESSGGGSDTVSSSVSWTLEAHFESLVLTGSGAINGTGNTLGNRLTGNDVNNSLAGGDGNDTLVGNGGSDTLGGGVGIDLLQGGSGNDTYLITSSDTVVEDADGGIDTMQSDVMDLEAASQVENLTLTGSATLKANGNSLNNVITGNAGINQIDGGGGNDVIFGGAGDDNIRGGPDGNDTLTGGAGNDTVRGDSGNDRLVLDSLVGSDLIQGFASGADSIGISMATLAVGNGNTVIDAALSLGSAGGWGVANELVVFSNDASGPLTTASAAAAIGSSTHVLAAGLTKIFVVDNGTSSGVYLFKSAAADFSVTAGELTLLATLEGVVTTSSGADYVFVS